MNATPPTSASKLWPRLTEIIGQGLDQGAVYGSICEQGRISGRFVLMSILSAAIATLGLLLSSPAVVIGAMLLSPLMDPIVLLGFSFWMVDWAATRRALITLATGFGLSLLVALVLTWASPLKEPTAEIIARSRPNLFDLLVAGFAGIAAGYGLIRQRGEAVIGVAIATALMPPIATVGFGLGSSNWSIAGGAGLLFATNLVAIALAGGAMAGLHGFRASYRWTDGAWIRHAAVVSVLVALCVPLTLSLQTIALEGRAAVAARRAIRDLFGDRARITSLSARSRAGRLEVDGLVAAPTFVRGADRQVAARLRMGLSRPAEVRLDQVVLADPSRLEPGAAPPPAPDLSQQLRAAVPFPADLVAVDPGSRRGIVLLSADAQLDLAAAKQLEDGLRREHGKVMVIPPLQPLPPLALTAKADAVSEPAALAIQAWALQRWRVPAVTAQVCGVRRKSPSPELLAALHSVFGEAPVDFAAGRSHCDGGRGPQLLLRAAEPATP
jgi:uncharacterized hydrophobic protein (TIGR00271 family)